MQRFRIWVGWLAMAVAVGTSVSCGGPVEGRVPVFPVRGTLLYRGAPAKGALVIFHPAGGPGSSPLTPNGRVQADGTFEMTTYDAGDGTPSGDFTVTCFWPEPPKSPVQDPDSGPDRLKGRYRDPGTTPLRVQIREGENSLEPFRLD